LMWFPFSPLQRWRGATSEPDEERGPEKPGELRPPGCCTTPAARHRRPKASDVYWEPWSL
jgi:hypothetical protein